MADQKPDNKNDKPTDTAPVAPAAPETPAPASLPGQTAPPPPASAPVADAPAEEVEVTVDPAAARQARLAEIDKELVRLDREIADRKNEMDVLRRERDRLQAQGLGPAMSQAEALQQVVRSDQEQRLNGAGLAAAVTGLVGGRGMPTVKTPAEIKAAMQKKTVAVKPLTPQDKMQ